MRALVKYLDNITDDDIIKLNIPTDTLFMFEPDNKLKTLRSYHWGNLKKSKKHQNLVAQQGKTR